MTLIAGHNAVNFLNFLHSISLVSILSLRSPRKDKERMRKGSMKGTKTISVVSKKVMKGYNERDAFLVFFSLSLNEKPFKPFNEAKHIDY
jgi:hypothetical protein